MGNLLWLKLGYNSFYEFGVVLRLKLEFHLGKMCIMICKVFNCDWNITPKHLKKASMFFQPVG